MTRMLTPGDVAAHPADRFSALRADYRREGPTPSNLCYGYVTRA